MKLNAIFLEHCGKPCSLLPHSHPHYLSAPHSFQAGVLAFRHGITTALQWNLLAVRTWGKLFNTSFLTWTVRITCTLRGCWGLQWDNSYKVSHSKCISNVISLLCLFPAKLYLFSFKYVDFKNSSHWKSKVQIQDIKNSKFSSTLCRMNLLTMVLWIYIFSNMLCINLKNQ